MYSVYNATMENTRIDFVVSGLPSPGGSKSAFQNKYTGKIVVVCAGGKKTKKWRTVVAEMARLAMIKRSFFQPPIGLAIDFRMPRPKNHYKKDGSLKTNSNLFHTVRPDSTKLLRSTEDAMTGIVWKDDAEIAEQYVTKTYSNSNNDIGARIVVWTITNKHQG